MRSENATSLSSVDYSQGVATNMTTAFRASVDNSYHHGRLYRFASHQAAATVQMIQYAAMALIDAAFDNERRGQQKNNAAFINAIAALADEPFSRIWDNPQDAEYDDL